MVRAAAGIADVMLRRRDRAGYVGLSSRVRWLTPRGGLRQWYPLAHTLVGEQPGAAHPGLGPRLLPKAILPPDALVPALGPLPDPLTGVQVPTATPWQLARRLFELERDRLRGWLFATAVSATAGRQVDAVIARAAAVSSW